MRTVTYVCGYEQAIQFARETKIPECKIVELNPIQLTIFNIDNYCQLHQIFRFERYTDSATGEMTNWYYDHYFFGIEILATGELFRLRESKKKGKFKLYPIEQQMLNHVQDFRYEEPEPNLIGVPTIKKIDAWISYIHMRETARLNYNNATILRNKTFADKFKAKYPNANYRTMADGWVSSFAIEHGALYFKYTSGNNGKFYREVSLIHKNVPTDEELLK